MTQETLTEPISDLEASPGFNEVHIFCNACMGPDANGYYKAICGYTRQNPRWKPTATATCTVCTDPAMQHRATWHGNPIWTS